MRPTAVGSPAPSERVPTVLWASVTITIPDPWAGQLAAAGAHAPHVTLFGPAPVGPRGIEALRDHVAAVTAEARPFELALEGTDTFRPHGQVVYVAVTDGAAECAALAAALGAGPVEGDGRFAYLPHVTIGYGEPDHVLDDRQAALADYEARFDVDAVFVSFGYGPAGRPAAVTWQPGQRCNLR